MTKKFVIIVEKVGRDYVASVPALYGCCAQTKTLKNLETAVIKAVRSYLKNEKDIEKFDFYGIRVIRMRGQGEFCAVIERGATACYVATVPSVDGCFTQARTVVGVVKNIEELLRFYLKERKLRKTKFIGIQIVDV